jgi:hypothetical protein
MAAAPTVVRRSAATCGNSESMTRTCACAAKPAAARSTIERVGVLWGDRGVVGEYSTADFTPEPL